MKYIPELADKIRKGEPLPRVIDVLLTTCTPLVRIGMVFRHALPQIRVNAKVISFGNLTVGGTGKTPAVIERAIEEIKLGRKVAVLTRGYGAKIEHLTKTVFKASSFCLDKTSFIGDEPALICKHVPEVILGVGKNRVANAKRAIDEFGCDTLILDDGFQYVRLIRDENILVIDATNPFGNGRLLPRGILREPPQAARRATQIILTRCDLVTNISNVVEIIKSVAPNIPIRLTYHAPICLERLIDTQKVPLEFLVGRNITAICAVGNPEAFVATLKKLGANVSQAIFFRDHARIPEETISPAQTVVVTEKDAMRLPNHFENVYALVVELKDFDNNADTSLK